MPCGWIPPVTCGQVIEEIIMVMNGRTNLESLGIIWSRADSIVRRPGGPLRLLPQSQRAADAMGRADDFLGDAELDADVRRGRRQYGGHLISAKALGTRVARARAGGLARCRGLGLVRAGPGPVLVSRPAAGGTALNATDAGAR